MKWILSIALLVAASLPAFAQESIQEHLRKHDKRLDALEAKVDRVLDFISANYGPGIKSAPKAAPAAAAVCADGVCEVPTASATRTGLFNGGGLFHRGGLLSRIHLPRPFKGGCR